MSERGKRKMSADELESEEVKEEIRELEEKVERLKQENVVRIGFFFFFFHFLKEFFFSSNF